MKRVALLGALMLLGCTNRYVRILQANHGREFRCDGRYVSVESGQASERWHSRGCGLEADWDCDDGVCALRDSRAWGMGAQ